MDTETQKVEVECYKNIIVLDFGWTKREMQTTLSKTSTTSNIQKMEFHLQVTSPEKAKMIKWMSLSSLFKSFILYFMYENCVRQNYIAFKSYEL